MLTLIIQAALIICIPDTLVVPLTLDSGCAVTGGSCAWKSISNYIAKKYTNVIIAIDDQYMFNYLGDEVINVYNFTQVIGIVNAYDQTQLTTIIDYYHTEYADYHLSGFIVFNLPKVHAIDTYEYIMSLGYTYAFLHIFDVNTPLTESDAKKMPKAIFVWMGTKDLFLDKSTDATFTQWKRSLVIIRDIEENFNVVTPKLNSKGVKYVYGTDNYLTTLSSYINGIADYMKVALQCDDSCGDCIGVSAKDCISCAPRFKMVNKICVLSSGAMITYGAIIFLLLL